MTRTIIQKDYYRIHGKWPGKFICRGMIDPNFRYLYIFRKASKYRKKTVLGVFYRILLYHYQVKYGFQIYPGTNIGEGFYLGHWGTVIINPKVKIGKNCNIATGVTIGQTNRGDKKGVPILGDEVWIGTNAVIVGDIKIGSNVLIAPNSYVTRDVPDNSVVVGNLARVMQNDEATLGYINNKV
ncbi:serine O-acetyltransferase [Apibacter adventoris]|uniref:Serine acetyltransferase n=1 Tax=Apibacter adventoris TaxID=1679466 RepID=A0A2S8ADW5_9FLAO|nr:serine acetyltransferase [Apibacter adventoris]PQL93080.1 serine acetyltransferase [Apibacter adventoris]PQL94762.1 serine acetyltransferase [Apibacter adventoris]